MRRSVPLLAAAALILALGVFSGPAASAGPANTLSLGKRLLAGQQLRSTNGQYALKMRTDGDLTVTGHSTLLWRARSMHPGAHLTLVHNGDLVLVKDSTTLWASNTRSSSSSTYLVITNEGSLQLRNAYGVVWSSRLGNACRTNTAAKRIIVSIGQQRARICAARLQVMTTRVTTGASAVGNGTPKGTWRVQAKQTNRYLYPASGGAYYVHYWVPYDGDYGLHDSSWQHFPYGSPAYRTQGSHGCVHVPGPVMGWFYRWAAVGTTVTITS
jgi:hypothetical protein